MDRRAFLGVGAASGLALATPTAGAQPTAAPAIPRPGPVGDMDAYVARVDAGMERITRWSLTADHPEFAGDREATDTLARSAIQTLYLTGMLGDLPLEQQQHAGMQERIWANLPLMDDALDRMHDFLASRTEADLARVQAALRSPEGVAERIADALDEQATLTGVSAWRRRQVRDTIGLAAWRLAHQPPALIVDEYQGKIERVDASDIAAEARQRWLASKVGEHLFWTRAGAAGGLVSTGAIADSARSTRDRRIARGAKAMGIGILIFALGAGLIAAGASGDEIGGVAAAGLITATVGSVWFLVGLIILLVGIATPGDAAATPNPSR